MVDVTLSSYKKIFFAVLLGASLSFGAMYLYSDDSDLLQQNNALKDQIAELEAELAKLQGQENHNQLASNDHIARINKNAQSTCEPMTSEAKAKKIQSKVKVANSAVALKSIETASVNDRRTFSEKINELLAVDASKENLALAMRSIFNLARDTENMTDSDLQSIYSVQSNADLKILIAQVLAQRGNSMLVDGQIFDAKVQLSSEQPKERQEALNQLAKLHSVKAVDAIVPLLQDGDVNVRLDALQALRATGNESHVSLVERMVHDPDEAVSGLANDVLSELKNLSRYARTSISSQDIAAELPVIEN